MTQLDEAALADCRKAFEEWYCGWMGYPKGGLKPSSLSNRTYDANDTEYLWKGWVAQVAWAGRMAIHGAVGDVVKTIEKAQDMVSALCKGQRNWIMSIPAQPDYDPDLVIGTALRTAKAALSALAPRPMSETRAVDGFNNSMLTAQAALRCLAAHPRPAGGQEKYNAEHLFQIADELEITRSQHATITEK